jgi:hypothetical protein
MAMSDAASYSAVEASRDGRRAGIRALRPDDQTDLIAAVGGGGAESFYRRFTRLAALEPHRRGRMTVALIHGTASSPSSNG